MKLTLLKQLLALYQQLLEKLKAEQPEIVIIHHTGGSDANPYADTSHHTVTMVDKWHKQLGFNKSTLGYYVGYHYFIDKHGIVTQCRSRGEMGCHTVGQNDKVGICLAGNFDATLPTEEQTRSLKNLLEVIGYVKEKNIKPVPHRKFAPHKSCYGSKLPDDWAENLIKT